MIVPTLRLGLGLRFPGPGPSFASTAVAVVLATPAYSANFTSLSSLPSWLSFSRASNAMVTDSTGKLTYAPNNLALYSQDLSNAAWTQTNCTRVDGITDPDGGTTASRFTATGTAFIYNVVTAHPNLNSVASIWVRRVSGAGTVNQWTTDGSTGPALSLTGSWQRFGVSGSTTGGAIYVGIIINTSGDVIEVAKGQGEIVTYETTPRTYNATTSSPYYGPRFDHAWNGSAWVAAGLPIEEQRTNLALQSQTLGTTWTTDGVSVTSDAATGPDGATTADKVIPSAATVAHDIYQPVTTASGSPHTWSVYAKAAGYNFALISADGASVRYGALVNLTTGAIVSNPTLGSPTGTSTKVTDVGNSWYRIAVTMTTDTVASYFGIAPVSSSGDTINGDNNPVFMGDGTSGMLFFGAQLEAGSFATSYIPTTSAAVTRSADILSASSPLDGYLAAGPSVWEFQDEATGTIARTAYAAGAFDWPVNKWYRSMGVYAAGTDTSSHMTVGGAY